MKILVLLFAALLVAGFCEKSSGEKPKSLSDADIERLLKVAVDWNSIQSRKGLYYQINKSKPFSGWTKTMYDSGQVKRLAQTKDGKYDDLWTSWHENGQKQGEGTWKDGELDGLQTAWRENGQKRYEATFKDGEEVSAKYWNSKGEEVDSHEEADE